MTQLIFCPPEVFSSVLVDFINRDLPQTVLSFVHNIRYFTEAFRRFPLNRGSLKVNSDELLMVNRNI